MPLVGNDLVDLTTECARNRYEDRRFLDKVLDDSERNAIRSCRKPNVLLWSFWACKEASYKALLKDNPKVSFVPRRYRVRLALFGNSQVSTGFVQTPAGTVPVRVEEGKGFLHSLALLGGRPGGEPILHRVLRLDFPGSCRSKGPSDLASVKVREVAAAHLARVIGMESSLIEVFRPKGRRGLGPPEVHVRGVKADLDISLSHDGRFAAFACCRRLDPAGIPRVHPP